jgi:hypothetical protein
MRTRVEINSPVRQMNTAFDIKKNFFNVNSRTTSPALSFASSATNGKYRIVPCRYGENCVRGSDCGFANTIKDLIPIYCDFDTHCTNDECHRFHPKSGQTIEQYAERNDFVFVKKTHPSPSKNASYSSQHSEQITLNIAEQIEHEDEECEDCEECESEKSVINNEEHREDDHINHTDCVITIDPNTDPDHIVKNISVDEHGDFHYDEFEYDPNAYGNEAEENDKKHIDVLLQEHEYENFLIENEYMDENGNPVDEEYDFSSSTSSDEENGMSFVYTQAQPVCWQAVTVYIPIYPMFQQFQQ